MQANGDCKERTRAELTGTNSSLLVPELSTSLFSAVLQCHSITIHIYVLCTHEVHRSLSDHDR